MGEMEEKKKRGAEELGENILILFKGLILAIWPTKKACKKTGKKFINDQGGEGDFSG